MSWLHKDSMQYLEEEDSSSLPSPRVVFEDNHLFIVFKPSRWLTQRDKTNDESLLDWSKNYIKEVHQKPGNVFLGLVHRLDRPASGLVIFGKTSKAASRLSELFRTHKIRKTYRVEVEGALEGEAELIHYLEEKDGKMEASLYASVESKKAELSYRLLQKRQKTSLLEVALKTGRKHQIRAQMSAIGHPVVGDRRYGSKVPYYFGRIKLMSYEAEFKHPTRNEKIIVTVPEPLQDWAVE